MLRLPGFSRHPSFFATSFSWWISVQSNSQPASAGLLLLTRKARLKPADELFELFNHRLKPVAKRKCRLKPGTSRFP